MIYLPLAHLEDFVADFNLPVLLFCWILTDIIDVPARVRLRNESCDAAFSVKKINK